MQDELDTFIEDFKTAFPTCYGEYTLMHGSTRECVSEASKHLMCVWLRTQVQALMLHCSGSQAEMG